MTKGWRIGFGESGYSVSSAGDVDGDGQDCNAIVPKKSFVTYYWKSTHRHKEVFSFRQCGLRNQARWLHRDGAASSSLYIASLLRESRLSLRVDALQLVN